MFKKNALISVFHKEGIEEFARELVGLGWTIYASGGTHKCITEAGIPATDVADLVGPPILGHRVVTLSREIHAGLLAQEGDEAELESLKTPWFGLVCVDLYPLEEAIARGAPPAEITEMTDIGGPTMLRSAAKSRRIVICKPFQRESILIRLRAVEGMNEEHQLLQHDHSYLEIMAATVEDYCANYCKQSSYGIMFRREPTPAAS